MRFRVTLDHIDDYCTVLLVVLQVRGLRPQLLKRLSDLVDALLLRLARRLEAHAQRGLLQG